MVDRLYYFLNGLNARWQNALLFIAGVFSALALPPVYLLPFLLISFPVWLLLLENAATPRRAFVMGWMFGFGYFTAGLYWIAAALFVDIQRYWWVLPFAVCGLPFLMSAYWGLAGMAWHYLQWRAWPKLLGFAVAYTLCEYLRGVVFTGFPWNYLGYSWVGLLPMTQSVALFGILGLTFVTVLLATWPYLYITRHYPHHRQRRAYTVSVIIFALLLGAWGAGRLSHHSAAADKAPWIRIVQPNVAQEDKWTPSQLEQQRDNLWRLSTEKNQNPLQPSLIVWPETAIALIDTMDVRLWEQQVQDHLLPGTLLASGALEADMKDNGEPTFYNRLDVFNAKGEPVARYAKSHLVPFGEYLPLEKYWPVKPPAVTAGSFSSGSGMQTQKVGTFPSFSPLICYEVIFPDAVADPKNRPDFLLNVTNDAWYGRTTGPFQHLAITQVRAIEQGLPLLRAANTGVSAVIDAQGRKIAALNLGEMGRLDAPLPQKVKPTLFARYGRLTWLLMLLLATAIAFFAQRAHQHRPVSVN